MSTHIEWVGAGDTDVTSLAPGEGEGEESDVSPGHIAVIAMVADNGIAILGTPAEVRDLLTRMKIATYHAEGRLKAQQELERSEIEL